MVNGSTSAWLSTSSLSANTSTRPVSIFSFFVPSGRTRTLPVTLDDALAVEPGGSLEQIGREIAGIKYRLRAALAIADVDEHHPAKVAVGVYPAIEGNDLADVFFP